MIHERIRTVDQQEVDVIDAHAFERPVDRGFDMGTRCIVIFHRRMGPTANRRDDVAFGDDLHLVAQRRVGAQGTAQDLFGAIIAIDIGLIKGGDALVQTCLNFCLDMGWRGVFDIANAPHAIDQSAEAEIRSEGYAIHYLRSPTPSGVAGVDAGTRP